MAKIEIHSNDLSGCNGYEIWTPDEPGREGFIKRGVFEDHLIDLLTEKQFEDFENSAYEFNVPNKRIFEVLGVMV